MPVDKGMSTRIVGPRLSTRSIYSHTVRIGQDITTCLASKLSESVTIKMNAQHFSEYQITRTIPRSIEAMYEYYLTVFVDERF